VGRTAKPRSRPYSEREAIEQVASWPTAKKNLPETHAALTCFLQAVAPAATRMGATSSSFVAALAASPSPPDLDQRSVGVCFWALPVSLLPGPTRPAAGGGLFGPLQIKRAARKVEPPGDLRRQQQQQRKRDNDPAPVPGNANAQAGPAPLPARFAQSR